MHTQIFNTKHMVWWDQSIWWFNFDPESGTTSQCQEPSQHMMEAKWSWLSQRRNTVVYENGLLLWGMHIFARNTLYIFIYAKGSIEKMKGFILFENQGISNPSNKQYLEWDYSPPREFSYRWTLFLLWPFILSLLYVYISSPLT